VAPRVDGLGLGGYCSHNMHDWRHGLRNSWLNNQVGRMAECAVGLNRLTVRVNMSNLQDRGANDKCTAEKAKSYPERMTCSLIGTAT
jgi:hypothetical protein